MLVWGCFWVKKEFYLETKILVKFYLNNCKLVVSAFKDDWMIQVFLSLLQIFNKFFKYKYQKCLPKCYYYKKKLWQA